MALYSFAQASAATSHATVQAGKSKQTQRVYSSVQGILRTLVQRGIFEEAGLPVDTAGLRKLSQNHTGNCSPVSPPAYHLFCATRDTPRATSILST